MHGKQEINLLLEFDSISGALQKCKIIRNIKDLMQDSSVSLMTIEDEASERTGSCDFCTNSYEIFLYRMNEEGIELEPKIELTEYPQAVTIKEEVYVEQFLPESIEEKPFEVVKKDANKKKLKTKPVGKTKKPRKSYKRELETTEDGYVKCDVCKTEFHSRKSLGNHLPFCNGNNLGRYRSGPNPSCSYCGKKFHTWHTARAHEKKFHTGTINYTCEVCGYNTPNKYSFDNHQLRDHKEKKHVVCDLCQYRCSDKNGIRSHMRLKHLQIDTHICEICAKVFADAARLKVHWIQKHSDERNFPCTVCEKAFKTNRALQGHMWQLHTPVEQKPKFSCDVCDFTTHCNWSMTQHKGIHLDNDECPYKCPICHRGFASKYRYKDHQLCHSQERPFKCETCEKSFKRKADLKIHTRYHTGEKPYECEICKQRYSDRGCYRSHLLVHEKQLGVTLDKSVKKFLEKPIVLPLKK